MGDVVQLFPRHTTVVAKPRVASAPRQPIDLDKVATIAAASAQINALARYVGLANATVPVIRGGKYGRMTGRDISAYSSDLLEARAQMLSEAEREGMPVRLRRAADRCIRAARW